MENLVSDEIFIMILITLLLESWDNFTGSFLGYTGNKVMITSYELVTVLLDEDQRRKPGVVKHPELLCCLKGRINKGLTKIRSAITAKRRVTSQEIVGGRVEERKDKGQKEGKERRIGQIRQRTLTQVSMMPATWLELTGNF